MEGLLGAERTGKYIVISLVVFVVGVIIGVVKLITGSLLLGVLVLLGLLWWLLRQVGALVMYPGSFFMTRSDIEMRYSREIGSRMVHCFNALHALGQSVAARTYHPYQNHTDFVMAIDRHVRAMLGMLGMFEASLSQRKSALLNSYRRLYHNLEAREGDYPCIFELMAKPRLISSLQEEDAAFYKARFAEIAGIIREMVDILKTYAPPTGAYELMRFRLKEESLYELRFGFYNWNVLYDYEIFTVLSGDANIETCSFPYLEPLSTATNAGPRTRLLQLNQKGRFFSATRTVSSSNFSAQTTTTSATISNRSICLHAGLPSDPLELPRLRLILGHAQHQQLAAGRCRCLPLLQGKGIRDRDSPWVFYRRGCGSGTDGQIGRAAAAAGRSSEGADRRSFFFVHRRGTFRLMQMSV
jgi:hypothetical protein